MEHIDGDRREGSCRSERQRSVCRISIPDVRVRRPKARTRSTSGNAGRDSPILPGRYAQATAHGRALNETPPPTQVEGRFHIQFSTTRPSLPAARRFPRYRFPADHRMVFLSPLRLQFVPPLLFPERSQNLLLRDDSRQGCSRTCPHHHSPEKLLSAPRVGRILQYVGTHLR